MSGGRWSFVSSQRRISAGGKAEYKKILLDGSDYGRVQFCPVGVYTIMEVKAGQGSKAGWGRLKSGIGWISLDFVKRL